jgi:gluconokinase
MVVILMGVSGSGKTTVGRRLAEQLGRPFCEGDDLHPPANVAKMARGEPLDDDDRRPWLEALRARIVEALQGSDDLVVACSALKAAYRRFLAVDGARVRFVYLAIPPAIAAARLAQRQGHFMKVSMVGSQFDTLEEPSPAEALILDATAPVDQLVAAIQASLSAAPLPPDLVRRDGD